MKATSAIEKASSMEVQQTNTFTKYWSDILLQYMFFTLCELQLCGQDRNLLRP